MTTIAFTVYHDEPNGDDITNESLTRDLLIRLANVAENEEMLEATGGELTDETHYPSTEKIAVPEMEAG